MKKKLKNSDGDHLVREINTLLYSYSHKRFFSFLDVTEVKLIVKALFEHVGVDNFIDKHEALNSYSREYTAHVKKVIRKL